LCCCIGTMAMAILIQMRAIIINWYNNNWCNGNGDGDNWDEGFTMWIVDCELNIDNNNDNRIEILLFEMMMVMVGNNNNGCNVYYQSSRICIQD
jgi:hypothetical protein